MIFLVFEGLFLDLLFYILWSRKWVGSWWSQLHTWLPARCWMWESKFGLCRRDVGGSLVSKLPVILGQGRCRSSVWIVARLGSIMFDRDNDQWWPPCEKWQPWLESQSWYNKLPNKILGMHQTIENRAGHWGSFSLSLSLSLSAYFEPSVLLHIFSLEFLTSLAR